MNGDETAHSFASHDTQSKVSSRHSIRTLSDHSRSCNVEDMDFYSVLCSQRA